MVSAVDAGILNLGLELATAFGEHWMSPIQPRLSAAHPELSPKELDQFDEISRKAMKRGHDLVPLCFRDTASVQREAYLLFEKRLREDYSWVFPSHGFAFVFAGMLLRVERRQHAVIRSGFRYCL